MQPRIRAATLTGYAGLASSLGLDPDGLVRAVGLDPLDLDGSDRWVPAAAAARLLELSAQQSGCADFGLRMAGLRRLGTLGPLSVVLRDEPTLRPALELLVRYEHTYNEALNMRMSVEEERTTFSLWLEFGEPAPLAQASDLVVGALLGIIRTLVGDDWMPSSVSFAHSPPDDLTPYHRLCGPRVRFADGFTGLVFPTRQLDTVVRTSDSSLRPYTREFLHQVVSSRAETTTARATEVVEFMLPLGRCSLQQVSRQLGLRPRQLQRLLSEEGASFSEVVHTARRHLAERHLASSRFTLTEISQLLGFAAPSAFSRWFAQHFGTSPSAWRSAARTQSAEDLSAIHSAVRARGPRPSSAEPAPR